MPGVFVVACLSVAAAFAGSAGSGWAAAGARPGAACARVGARTKTSTGAELVCTRVGKTKVWRRGTTGKGTTAVLTQACVTTLVRFGSMTSAPATDSAMAALVSSLAKCQKDTGKTVFVTAPPFNLQDVASITKFRSCVGHDYSEGSVDGQVVSDNPSFEKFSSMKHYVTPLADAAGNRTSVFAPFDGVVTAVVPDTGKTSNGASSANPGSQIHLVPYANPAYTFTFMHIYGISVKPGDRVKGGQKLGYHEVPPQFAGHDSFDIAMSKFDLAALQAHVMLQVSFMTVLSAQVGGTFASAGLTPATTIWPRAYRESHPCQVGQGGFFVGAPNPDDTVTLKH